MATAQGQWLLLRHCCRSPIARTWNHGPKRSLYQLRSFKSLQTCSVSRMGFVRLNSPPSHVTTARGTTRTFSDAKTQPLPTQEIAPVISSSEITENILAGFEGTPGQALLRLNLKRDKVHPAEIVEMCKSVRAGYPRDAVVIQFALKAYKKRRNLVIDKPEASVAMEAMMKAGLSTDNESKVQAALLVLDTFRDTSSCLYYAAPMSSIDEVLAVLSEGVQQASLPRLEANDNSDVAVDEEATPTEQEGDIVRKRYIRKRLKQLRLVPTATPPKKKKEKPREDDVGQYRSRLVKETTLGVVELLCLRKERPYRLMKKRSARAYMKQIRSHHGPTPTTIQICATIISQLCGPAEAMENVIKPCLKARCPVPRELIQEIKTAMERKQRESEEAKSSIDDTEGDGEVVSEKEAESKDDQ